ncbi:MAG: hypothetical protein IPM29_21060 [Planctomycetes bacterium]|nr:hypothetical protein [Planctomycetota bacterium]
MGSLNGPGRRHRRLPRVVLARLARRPGARALLTRLVEAFDRAGAAAVVLFGSAASDGPPLDLRADLDVAVGVRGRFERRCWARALVAALERGGDRVLLGGFATPLRAPVDTLAWSGVLAVGRDGRRRELVELDLYIGRVEQLAALDPSIVLAGPPGCIPTGRTAGSALRCDRTADRLAAVELAALDAWRARRRARRGDLLEALALLDRARDRLADPLAAVAGRKRPGRGWRGLDSRLASGLARRLAAT